MAFQTPPDYRIVRLDQLNGHGIAEFSRHLGRTDHVGEHDGAEGGIVDRIRLCGGRILYASEKRFDRRPVFLVARGLSVGKSLVEREMIDTVKELLAGPDGAKIILPVDIVTGDAFAENAARDVVLASEIPDSAIGLDIGPESGAGFWELIESSASVFWNGPMGVFEWVAFRNGTDTVARALASCDGFTVVGGGDSAAALRLLKLDGSVSHLSTGGGAGLELLEGRVLPGVQVLERWVS